MSGILPTDLASLKAFGLDRWRETFFWPVSDPDFFAIAEETLSAFDRQLSTLEPSEPVLADIFLADTAFLDTILQSTHMQLAQKRASAYGRELATKNGPQSDLNSSAASLLLKRQLRKPHLPRRALVRSAKRFLFNDHNSLGKRVVAMMGRADAWMLGSLAPLHAAYANTLGLIIDAPYIASLIGDLGSSEPCPAELNLAVRRTLSELGDRLSLHFGGPFDLSNFESPWCARLGLLAAGMTNIQKLEPPSTVLLGEISKPWSKVTASGLRRRGTKIVGANHGNFVGQMSMPGSAWHSHAHCDEILCYSHRNADLLADDYNATTIGKRRNVRFIKPAQDAVLSGVATSIRSQQTLNNDQTVMIIGYPMTQLRYGWSAGDYYLFQVDVELRIAALLRKAGFRTIYKMHPDRQAEARGVFENQVDEIIIEQFETSWIRADAFVFGNIMTTVFNIAAMTNRPIVALDIEGYRWMPGMQHEIGKRVNFIPASFNNDNRIEFDSRALLDGIVDKSAATNHSYIDVFLLDKPEAQAGIV